MYEVAFLVRGPPGAHAPLGARARCRLAWEAWRQQLIRASVCRARGLRAAALRLIARRTRCRQLRAAQRILSAWQFWNTMRLDWSAFLGQTEEDQQRELFTRFQ
jgi:hypothetical protein